jgi:diaminopimelate decarboxylase
MYYPHDIHRVKGELTCERVPLARIAEAVGTPVYIYSHKTIVEHVRKLKAAFAPVRPLICFSVKANGNLAILRIVVREGAGLDIVSGGELYKALRVECPPSRIVFASVGKRPEEIRAALRAGIFCFNVESAAELRAISEEAAHLGRLAPVALRINPDVEAHTHRFMTTGTAQTKFGIGLGEAERLITRRWTEFPAVRLLGVHVHIGSQITEAAPFVRTLKKLHGLIARIRRAGRRIEWLNLGGGLGIVYRDERPQTAQAFARAVLPLIRPLGVKLILEPGRFIVGNAGVLLTRVLYVKTPGAAGRDGRQRFLVVDAGMNDLVRPALYDAYHEVLPVGPPRNLEGSARCDVVGPICESADVLARDRRLGMVRPGELLAILGAGAYGSTMASNYNGRLRPAEVLVRGRLWDVIRRRETLRDLVRWDVLPRQRVRRSRAR